MGWSTIVTTCRDAESVMRVETELHILQKKGKISPLTKLLSVEDPFEKCGSGAATLNALFVVTEHLSAERNYSLVNADVLKDERILILHCGREYIYNFGNSKALLGIPLSSSKESSKIDYPQEELCLNLEHLINFCGQLQDRFPEPGCWICSTEMSFLYQNLNTLPQVDKDNTIIFTVEMESDYATRHGIVVSDVDKTVSHIHYCLEKEIIDNLYPSGSAPVVAGIIFFPTSVTESMLAFHSISPLDSCTYVGMDGGAEPLQISLFFDILTAMTTGVDKEGFVSGKAGKLYEEKMNLTQRKAISRARSKIWEFLSVFKLQEVCLQKVRHVYWDDRLSAMDHVRNMQLLSNSSSSLSNNNSFARDKNETSMCKAGLFNSFLQSQSVIQIGENSLISDSIISATEITIGKNCFLSGVNCVLNGALRLPDDLTIIQFNLNNENVITVVFGTQDIPFTPLNRSKFFNIYEKTLNGLQITIDPLIQLRNAKIFPAHLTISEWLCCLNSESLDILYDIQRAFTITSDQVNMLSLSDILDNTSLGKTFDWNQNVKTKITHEFIRECLQLNRDTYLIPYFKASLVEGKAMEMLEVLDSVALQAQSNNQVLRRCLSCIADLLGLMAGNVGCMRSGPGSNKIWDSAFTWLRFNNFDAALKQLINIRNNWLGRKDLLIRAARHYERALQILIECAVVSANYYINLSDATLPEIDDWVIAECPCRIDLQGGWTDTPPICFEIGGSVVNIAVTIDGSKPIGARAKRIPEPKLVLVLRGEGMEMLQELIITELKDILDYTQPAASGALLKAALICTNTINLNEELKNQLPNGGIQLEAWSILPQGSGLGTSSILAGAVIAVLWTVLGHRFDKKSLIHSVLCLEQMLTTGGGWQDQVGGLMGGINRGFSIAKLPLEVQVQKVELTPSTLTTLNQHLLLIYTGKVRLAKNLLQNVIRNFYAQEEEITGCFKELFKGSLICAEAIEAGDLVKTGQEMNKYWVLKTKLAPGSEPAIVTELMQLLEPRVHGQLLVGAGGGGFMCILTKEPNQKNVIQALIKKFITSDFITVHSVLIDVDGITLKHKENIIFS